MFLNGNLGVEFPFKCKIMGLISHIRNNPTHFKFEYLKFLHTKRQLTKQLTKPEE